MYVFVVFFFEQRTAYGMRISDWSSDVCSSDLLVAATLAAGRVVATDAFESDARRFVDANFEPGYLDATITAFDITPDAGLENLTAHAAASLPTRFMHLFGFDSTTISVTTVVERRNRSAELVLVLDVTGSMRSGGRIEGLKAAARDMLNILFGDEDKRKNLYVGIVPYEVTVNIGTDNKGWPGIGREGVSVKSV